MGIEVKVPEREFKEIHRIGLNIAQLDSNTYQIEDIEYLGEVLNFFFYKPRAPIINRVIDCTGLDISNGILYGNAVTSCSPIYGRTVELKIKI